MATTSASRPSSRAADATSSPARSAWSSTTSSGRGASRASARHLVRPARPARRAPPHRGRELRWRARPASRLFPIPSSPASVTSPPPLTLRFVPPRAKPRQLGVAPDERRRRSDVELVREVHPRRHELERFVVAQHGVLERPQLRSRLDAEVVGELLARVPIGVERLRLAPAPIEREHQVAGEPLAGGLLGHEPPQLADDLRVSAGGEVGLDADLERGRVAAPRAARSRPRRTARTPGRRAAVRARARVPRAARGRLCRASPAASARRPSSTSRSKRSTSSSPGCYADPVAGRRGADDLTVAERLAQARDVYLHGAHAPRPAPPRPTERAPAAPGSRARSRGGGGRRVPPAAFARSLGLRRARRALRADRGS